MFAVFKVVRSNAKPKIIRVKTGYKSLAVKQFKSVFNQAPWHVAELFDVIDDSVAFWQCPTRPSRDEPLPGVLGNKGTGAFIFREQGICSVYFQGTRELLSRLLGTREHQSIFNTMVFFFTFRTPKI